MAQEINVTAWVVCYKKAGQLNMEQRFYGPFDTYEDAESFLVTLQPPGPGGHKYIDPLYRNRQADD